LKTSMYHDESSRKICRSLANATAKIAHYLVWMSPLISKPTSNVYRLP
jgi:hypothetical protein